MWDDSKQIRLNQLREAKAKAALTDEEHTELSALIEERCCYETAAIETTTRQTQEKNTWTMAKIQKVQAQNHQLEALIQEQEAYLAEVQPLIAQMEKHRRDWRERYTQVTGKLLSEPVAVEGGS